MPLIAIPLSPVRPPLLLPFLTLLVWLLLGSVAHTEEANWLQGRDPIQVLGVRDSQVATDGRMPLDGAAWNVPLAARLQNTQARLVYDLGSPRQLGCLWLQADNNDEYLVLHSLDGRNFSPLWTAPQVAGMGLRVRHTSLLTKTRYLALMAQGGDGYYSVAEFGAAASCPKQGLTQLLQRVWLSSESQIAQAKLWLATLLALGWVLYPGRGKGYDGLVLGSLALLSAVIATQALWQRYPIFEEEPLLRGLIALLAGGIALREGFGNTLGAARRRAHTGLLGLLALLAVGCYYHFGTYQFWDQANARPTGWHTFDMRHYFPQAKYFKELRFDGLYVASLGAYLDNTTGAQLETLQPVRLRDLKTSQLRYAPSYAPELAEVRARFTPERWAEFRQDMFYIQRTMGDRDYLGSMQDHGGNATPVWILSAWLLFKNLPASEATLSLAGLIDPALLVVLFIAIWRSFGSDIALYAAILFGATDFYMFGSNLMGSTLRQDWLVALGLGACALKAERTWLGGAVLAYGALIRAFPAMATVFLAVPVLWWLVEELHARRWPSPGALWRAQKPALQAGFGAAASVVVMLVLTSMVFGFQESWGNWYAKISIHAADPSVNNIGMRNLMSFDPEKAARHVLRRDHPEPWIEWLRLQRETYDARLPFTVPLTLAGLALCLLAARGRPLHQSVLIGLLTIPFLFYPSNYYFHYIFLLPLALYSLDPDDVRTDRSFALGIAALLALCFGQYLTTFERWSDLKFTYQNFLLFAAFVAVLLLLVTQSKPDLRLKP
jgi:hypothetical protein